MFPGWPKPLTRVTVRATPCSAHPDHPLLVPPLQRGGLHGPPGHPEGVAGLRGQSAPQEPGGFQRLVQLPGSHPGVCPASPRQSASWESLLGFGPSDSAVKCDVNIPEPRLMETLKRCGVFHTQRLPVMTSWFKLNYLKKWTKNIDTNTITNTPMLPKWRRSLG